MRSIRTQVLPNHLLRLEASVSSSIRFIAYWLEVDEDLLLPEASTAVLCVRYFTGADPFNKACSDPFASTLDQEQLDSAGLVAVGRLRQSTGYLASDYRPVYLSSF